MYKTQTSFKHIKQSFTHRICIPYCSAHYLLIDLAPMYYTCGVYGWNADIYYIDFDTVIMTGYRPQSYTAFISHNIIDKYEKRAAAIYCSTKYKYDTKRKKIENLRNELINKYIQEV